METVLESIERDVLEAMVARAGGGVVAILIKQPNVDESPVWKPTVMGDVYGRSTSDTRNHFGIALGRVGEMIETGLPSGRLHHVSEYGLGGVLSLRKDGLALYVVCSGNPDGEEGDLVVASFGLAQLEYALELEG